MGRVSDAGERIVRAAARLFLTRSCQDVSIDDICAAADVRKGSFYHYFPSKADLVKAVVDLHASALWDAMDSARDTGGETAVRRLFAMADAIGAIQTEFEQRHGRVVGCPFGNLAAELSTINPELSDHLAQVLGEIERRLAVVCRAAVDEGAWRPGVDPDQLARSLNALIQGTILLAKVNGSCAASIGPALHSLVANHLKDDVAAVV
jgi:TetR/AcrR family transcriptional regulator, transcriptional repressor for nem operon